MLPPQSPARVGDAPDAVPARLMSRKSQSVAEMALTVRVRGVPMVLDCKKMRRTADAPAQVRVPVIVWFSEKENNIYPAVDGAAHEKSLKVLLPEIVVVPPCVVLVNEILLYVRPPKFCV